MYFAQGSTQPSVLIDFKAAIARHADIQWHLLIDSAFEESRLPDIHTGANLYEVAGFTELRKVGPWLISLPGNDAQGREQQLKFWLDHCSGRPMLSLIGSRRSAQEIATEWAALHFVNTTDDEQYLIRIADTRTLPELAKTLTPAQWAAWTGLLTHWISIDREGAVAMISLATPETSPASAPLVLDEAQIQSFADAAEADALIDYVEQTIPDLTPTHKKLSPNRWHEAVSSALQHAREHRIERLEDKLALLQAAVLTNGICLKDERVLNMLICRQWNSGRLSDALLETGVLD